MRERPCSAGAPRASASKLPPAAQGGRRDRHGQGRSGGVREGGRWCAQGRPSTQLRHNAPAAHPLNLLRAVREPGSERLYTANTVSIQPHASWEHLPVLFLLLL